MFAFVPWRVDTIFEITGFEPEHELRTENLEV